MNRIIKTSVTRIRSSKVVGAFIAVAAVAVIGTSSAAAASPSFFNVPKPTGQKICYAQYGEGWKKAGFINLDHCLRYVSTKAPKVAEECNHGWWYVLGFNSRGQCVAWVVQHGGSGYGGDPNDQF